MRYRPDIAAGDYGQDRQSFSNLGNVNAQRMNDQLAALFIKDTSPKGRVIPLIGTAPLLFWLIPGVYGTIPAIIWRTMVPAFPFS
jgi:hypothetical protein